MSIDPTASDDLWAGVAAVVDGLDLDAMNEQGMLAVHAGSSHRHSTVEMGARLAVQLMLAGRRYQDAVETLAGIVAGSSQRLVILKGLEVAQRYPEPAQRQFSDLDLLVEDPEQLFVDLGDMGYRALPDIVPDGHHHLAPMVKEDSDFSVEIHRRPGWLHWMSPPTVDELFGRIVPAETPIADLWTLEPIDHCLFVAVHAWADGAFRRARDVLDIAVMRAGLDQTELARRADAWGIGRMWRVTERCVDSLFLGGRSSAATRLLTGHIAKGRIRGPVSHRASVYLADFRVTSPWQAIGSVGHKLRDSDVVNVLGR